MTFTEALVRCAIHGELTEEMAREWFDGEDQELALKVVRDKHLHTPWPGHSLLRRAHDMLVFHTKGLQCHCGYRGKCEVCLARELITELHTAAEGGNG